MRRLPRQITLVFFGLLLSLTIPTLLHAVETPAPGNAAPGNAGNTLGNKPAPAGADSAAELDAYLSREFWRESSRGLTLRPPLGSKLRHETVDDNILTIAGETGYTIRVALKKSTSALEIPKVMEWSAGQLGIARPQAKVLEAATELTLNQRAAGRVYFDIPDAKLGRWVLGHTFIRIDAHTLALLTLEVPYNRFAEVRPVYQALCQSVNFEDPRKLEEERRKLIEAGNAWKKNVTAKLIQTAFGPERWFRIVQDGNDIGYMRLSASTGKELNMPGLKVEVQARLKLNDGTYDTLSQAFLAEDLSQEIWSIRTTLRPVIPMGNTSPRAPQGDPKKSPHQPPALPSGKGEPGTISWAESGLRAGPVIRLSREGPTGVQNHEWPTPDQAYLSQVELTLLGSLLPHQQSGSFGFYAYYPNTGKITFRTERIEVQPDGTYTLYSRPSLEQPENTTKFDASGQILARELGEGRKLLPATKGEVTAIWKFR